MKRKQRIAIYVEIDQNGPQTASGMSPIDPETEMEGIDKAFSITVSPDRFATGDPTGTQALKTTLAHELGHVMGAILQTPAYVNDPRGTLGRSGGGAEAIVASEREAWEMGALIYPGMDWLEADRNLGTYNNPESRESWEFQIALMRLFPPTPFRNADGPKHTPGPWHIGEKSYTNEVYNDNGTRVADCFGPKWIPALEEDDENNEDVAQANARLIAAAPELLEACKAALWALEFDAQGDIEQLKDAIAKAEGRV